MTKNGQKVITDKQSFGKKMSKEYNSSNTYYKDIAMWFDSTFLNIIIIIFPFQR